MTIELSPAVVSALITTFNYMMNRRTDAELWISDEDRAEMMKATVELSTKLIADAVNKPEPQEPQ